MPQTREGKLFPPIPKDAKMPFYYASASFFWLFYAVDAKALQGYLAQTGLTVARFKDLSKSTGVVALNFQNYSDHLGQLVGTVNEVEFNIHSFPTAWKSSVPLMSFDDYLFGQEQTKTIGSFRLHVPADNEIAVNAGRAAFGERKFLDKFCYDVPAGNNPANMAHQNTKWDYIVADPCHLPKEMPFVPSAWPKGTPYIYRATADLSSMTPRVGNASPLTLYSMLPGGPDLPPGGPKQKLIGSRWNVMGVYRDYYPLSGSDRKKVKLKIGSSKTEMCQDMKRIFGSSSKLLAVRIYQSPPVAIENRAYYIPKK